MRQGMDIQHRKSLFLNVIVEMFKVKGNPLLQKFCKGKAFGWFFQKN